jgi:hypothetical protein
MARKYSSLLVIVGMWLLSAPVSYGKDSGTIVFMTSQEADQLSHSEAEWKDFIAEWITLQRSGDLYYASKALPGNGPIIIIQVPETAKNSDIPTIETTTTTDLLIVFQDGRTPVDMETLQVVAKKGFFKKSLTHRLKPYIQGTSLHARSVTIPTGKFLIQVSIADRGGIKTTETYLLKVASFR